MSLFFTGQSSLWQLAFFLLPNEEVSGGGKLQLSNKFTKMPSPSAVR